MHKYKRDHQKKFNIFLIIVCILLVKANPIQAMESSELISRSNQDEQITKKRKASFLDTDDNLEDNKPASLQLISHSEKITKNFECTQCLCVVFSEPEIIKHVNEIHPHSKHINVIEKIVQKKILTIAEAIHKHDCSLCDKLFFRRSDYIKHLQSFEHAQSLEKTNVELNKPKNQQSIYIYCDFCKKEVHKDYLNKHSKSIKHISNIENPQEFSQTLVFNIDDKK